MSKIIPLHHPIVPDPEYISEDQFGTPMYRFALEFKYDETPFAVDIWAYDRADAERRLISMKETLTVCGQIFGSFDPNDPTTRRRRVA